MDEFLMHTIFTFVVIAITSFLNGLLFGLAAAYLISLL